MYHVWRTAGGALFHFGFRMASASSEISFELKKKAHKLCKKYLGGSWKNVSLDEFSIEVLRYVSLIEERKQ